MITYNEDLETRNNYLMDHAPACSGTEEHPDELTFRSLNYNGVCWLMEHNYLDYDSSTKYGPELDDFLELCRRYTWDPADRKHHMEFSGIAYGNSTGEHKHMIVVNEIWCKVDIEKLIYWIKYIGCDMPDKIEKDDGGWSLSWWREEKKLV